MKKYKTNPKNILHLLRHDYHRFETDPAVQLRYHRRMVVFWLLNFPIITLLFFGLPVFWLKIGLALNTFYSLYANLDTEMGDAHSAYGSLKAEQAAARSEFDEDQLDEVIAEVIN